MDRTNCAVGLLTSYDTYIVVLRLAIDHIVISSPVIRDATFRRQLPLAFGNDMSVFDLLLALLLFTARPERLKGQEGMWLGLYVKEEVGEKKTHGTKRKGKERDDVSPAKKRSQGGAGGSGGPSGGMNDDTRGGEWNGKEGERDGSPSHRYPPTLDSAQTRQLRLLDPPPKRPRRSDESSVSDGALTISNPSDIILTPSSTSFNITPAFPHIDLHSKPCSSSPSPPAFSLSPTLSLKIDPPSRGQFSILDAAFFRNTPFFPVVPSKLGQGGTEVQCVLDRILASGEHYITFSGWAGSSGYRESERNEGEKGEEDNGEADPEESFKASPGDDSQLTATSRHTNSRPVPSRPDPHPPNLQPAPFRAQSLIFKLAYLIDRENHKMLRLPSGADVACAVENEVRALSGPLADLQGGVVPRLQGLWRSVSGEWAVIVLEMIDGRGLLRGEDRLGDREA